MTRSQAFESAPVPPRPGPGVCPVCLGPVNDGYSECLGCHNNISLVPARSSIGVIPLGIAVKGEPLAVSLWRYKRADDKSERREHLGLLTEYFDARMTHLDACPDAALPAFDLVTVVPGTKSAGVNPVHRILGASSWAVRQPLHETLVPGADSDQPDHRGAVDKFRCPAELSGHRSVLLVDDTWTSGANALSAASALLRAGAGHVTVVVLGRHVDPGYSGVADFVQRVEQQHPSRRCALCSPSLHTPAALTTLPRSEPRPADPKAPAASLTWAMDDLPTVSVASDATAGASSLGRQERWPQELEAAWSDVDEVSSVKRGVSSGLKTMLGALAFIGVLAFVFAALGVGEPHGEEVQLVKPSQAELRAALDGARQLTWLSRGGSALADRDIDNIFLTVCRDYMVDGREQEARREAERSIPAGWSSRETQAFMDFIDFVLSTRNPYCEAST